MKILGVFIILSGIVCFALVATGLVGWMTPAPADGSIDLDSVVDGIVAQLLLPYAAGTVCLIAGSVAVWLGIKKSRELKKQGKKTGFRSLITASLVALALFACSAFAVFMLMARWDPDEEWAAEVIEESAELRRLLDHFHEEEGEFPKSLDEIDEDYTKPTDYLSRHGAAPDMGRWFYDRIGKDDYQLFVTADSWVSYFDAMVYRHTGAFSDPWFAGRDPSDSREFGKWKYVRGFSRFHEKFYFDVDGNIQE